jgi:CheY-like chemotaxis protein
MNAQRQEMRRVLVVDDDPRLVFAVEEALNDAGYETKTASNGHAAMQKLSTFAPDVIVLDLMMPYMGGFELLNCLRHKGLDIPVVIASTDDDWKAPEVGAIVKLTKPFTLEQLLDGVAAALKLSAPESKI